MEELIYILTNNSYLYWSIIIVLLIVDVILAIISLNRKKREEIKEEFKKAEIAEEVEKKEETKVSKELQDIIMQMKKDMEATPEQVVAQFEEEQEKNAIISYQELVESVKNGKIQTIDDEEGNINYVEALSEEINEEPIVEAIDNEALKEEVKSAIQEITKNSVETEKPKFKSTDFISPVFGKMNAEINYPKIKETTEIEKMFNIDKIKNELEKNEAFLNALIEFRNNL